MDIFSGGLLTSGGLLVVAVALRAGLRLATGPSPSPRRSNLVDAVRVFSWVLIIIAVLIFPIAPWFAIWAAIVGMLYHRHVAAQQDTMMGLVASAAERNIPLPLAFAAMGAERGGWLSERADIVAELMTGGKSLPDALRIEPTVMPRDALPLIAVGCASGSLGPALRRMLTSRHAMALIWQAIVGRATYLLYLPAFVVFLLTFIFVVIVPQFNKIFRDFGLYSAVNFNWGHPLMLPAGVMLVIFCWLLIYYTLLRFSGAISWDLPGFGWFMRRLDRAVVLDALSLAAAGQRPLSETIGILADTYPKRAIRRRLERANVAIDQGHDGLECLRQQGLLGLVDLAVLQAAVRNGNLAWAAREMADSNRRRFQYRTLSLMHTIFPTIIILLACVVALVALSLFLPLIALITNLAQ